MQKVAVYVPSTINGNEPAPLELVSYWLSETKKLMASLFGGFTAYVVKGGWMSKEKGLIEEDITIIESLTDDNGLEKLPEVKFLAHQMAQSMTQETVAVKINGALEFVS